MGITKGFLGWILVVVLTIYGGDYASHMNDAGRVLLATGPNRGVVTYGSWWWKATAALGNALMVVGFYGAGITLTNTFIVRFHYAEGDESRDGDI